MATPEVLLLLGRDHGEYGKVHARAVADGRAAAAISVGADPGSPSLAFKGDARTCPNEDALLLAVDGEQILLAVADGHLGETASHDLVESLARAASEARVPDGLEGLVACVRGLGRDPAARPRREEPGATLVAAVLDARSRQGAVASWGDSSLLWVGPSGERRLNRKRPHYVSLDRPGSLLPGRAHLAEFHVEAGGLLVAFTDGVDECHYRSPATSVRERHRAGLFGAQGADPLAYAEGLAELALRGVDGHPGGQDNVAVVAVRT